MKTEIILVTESPEWFLIELNHRGVYLNIHKEFTTTGTKYQYNIHEVPF